MERIHERSVGDGFLHGRDGPTRAGPSQESGDRKVVQFRLLRRWLAGVLEQALARSPEAGAALRLRCAISRSAQAVRNRARPRMDPRRRELITQRSEEDVKAAAAALRLLQKRVVHVRARDDGILAKEFTIRCAACSATVVTLWTRRRVRPDA